MKKQEILYQKIERLISMSEKSMKTYLLLGGKILKKNPKQDKKKA